MTTTSPPTTEIAEVKLYTATYVDDKNTYEVDSTFCTFLSRTEKTTYINGAIAVNLDEGHEWRRHEHHLTR